MAIARYILLACIAASFLPVSKAQTRFRSDLYLGANFSTGRYQFSEKTGPFNLGRGSVNQVLGYSARLYLNRSPVFLQTGLQFRYAQSGVKTVNTVPGFTRAELRWRARHENLTVPLHVGRSYTLGSKRIVVLEPYAGVSIGWCGLVLDGGGYSTQALTADTLGVNVSHLGDQFERRFLATIDLGATFVPFPRHPKFGFGADVSLNLTPTPEFRVAGSVSNYTQGVSQLYTAAFTRRYLNAAITARYAFGRGWKKSVQALAPKRIRKEEPLDD